MRNAVVVDSGPLIALFDRDDANHASVVGFLAKHPKLRLLTTWSVLNEASALLSARVSKQAEIDLLEWVERKGLQLVTLETSAISRVRALITKYRDLPFDFADASVAVLAEQTGIQQVLTLDRDFEVYRDAKGKLLKDVLAGMRARAR